MGGVPRVVLAPDKFRGSATAADVAAALGALPLLLEECAIRKLAAGPLAEHGLDS